MEHQLLLIRGVSRGKPSRPAGEVIVRHWNHTVIPYVTAFENIYKGPLSATAWQTFPIGEGLLRRSRRWEAVFAQVVFLAVTI